MVKARTFHGVIAPVATPFGADGAPDPDRFIAHADWLLRNGCAGLAPFGTTSEANSLGLDERMELLEELIDAGIDAAQLMPGTGACALPDAIAMTQHAVDLGCGGCLMLPPFFYKAPSEDGLFEFFAEVIEAVGDERLKVYLYHIPPIAQVGFSMSLIARLLKAYPTTIKGLKDSTGDWTVTKGFLTEFPDLEIFPGAESYLLDALTAGASGTISASANVNPSGIRALYDAAATPAAAVLQEKIKSARSVFQAQPLIPTIKGVIAHYRQDPLWAQLRPPLTALPAKDLQAVIAKLEGEHGFKMDIGSDEDDA